MISCFFVSAKAGRGVEFFSCVGKARAVRRDGLRTAVHRAEQCGALTGGPRCVDRRTAVLRAEDHGLLTSSMHGTVKHDAFLRQLRRVVQAIRTRLSCHKEASIWHENCWSVKGDIRWKFNLEILRKSIAYIKNYLYLCNQLGNSA